MVTIEPLPRADPERVGALIREVIAAHPDIYAPGDGWQEDVVRTMKGIVPYNARGLLDRLLVPKKEFGVPLSETDRRLGQEQDDERRLGW